MANFTMTIERQAFTFTYKKAVDEAELKKVAGYDEKNLDSMVMDGKLDAVVQKAIYYDINQHSLSLRNIMISPPSNIDIMAIHPSYKEAKDFNVIQNIDAEKKAETNDILNAKRRFYLAVKKSKFNLRVQSTATVTDFNAEKLAGKFINDDGAGDFVFSVNNSLLAVSSTFEFPQESDKNKDINLVIDMPRYTTDNMQGFNDSKRFNLTINTTTIDATLKKSYLVFAKYAMPNIYVGMTLGKEPE